MAQKSTIQRINGMCVAITERILYSDFQVDKATYSMAMDNSRNNNVFTGSVLINECLFILLLFNINH